MAKCRCKTTPRICSDAVQSLNECGRCKDVCTNPICGDPRMLGLYAPVIYDEIGINLCTTFDLGVTIPTAYPTATNATAKVLNITYSYGTDAVNVENIPGRPNCYRVTLTNIAVQFAVNLYDDNCRLLTTLTPTATYLPSDTTAPTYDEDTNPTSVELEIYAPYGLSYDTTTTPATPTPVINNIGFAQTNQNVAQGLNLFGISKLLNLDTEDSSASIGLTLVLQSLYYVGYKVPTMGKIEIPKGSIVTPEDTDCLRFVAGDLLNLAIKPLELGHPTHEERYKQECTPPLCCACDSCTTPLEQAIDTTAITPDFTETTS